MEAASLGRRNAVWPRLWPHVVGATRTGDTLAGREAEWLAAYLAAPGRAGIGPDEVQTVQLPRDWARAVLKGSDACAGRAIEQLMNVGLLDLVHRGEPNHAGLYAVMPLPVPEPNPPPSP